MGKSCHFFNGNLNTNFDFKREALLQIDKIINSCNYILLNGIKLKLTDTEFKKVFELRNEMTAIELTENFGFEDYEKLIFRTSKITSDFCFIVMREHRGKLSEDVLNYVDSFTFHSAS